MTEQLPKFESKLPAVDTSEIERIMSKFGWFGGIFVTLVMIALGLVVQLN